MDKTERERVCRPLRVIFMGSAEISLTMFNAVAGDPGCDLVGVVAQPDRPRGRRGHSAPCQVKARALELGIPVITPENVNTPDVVTILAGLMADVAVVVAYGQFLGRAVREVTPMGCVNLHLSLLPKYRGAAPIQWAIVRGERETGVSSMLIDAGMDTGDILMQARTPIGDTEIAGDLYARLAELGAGVLLRTLHGLSWGMVIPVPQDDSAATPAPKIRKSDGRVDWSLSAAEICLRIRGFNPWPGSYCLLPAEGGEGTPGERASSGSVMKIHSAFPLEGSGVPGEVLHCGSDGLHVAAGAGVVSIQELQPEGKRRMTVTDYIHGHTVFVGGIWM